MIHLVAMCLLCAVFQNLHAEDAPLTLSRPLVFKWLFEPSDPISDSPVIHKESLYVQASVGVVTSIRLPDGQLQWRSDIGGVISARPVADERAAYVATESVSIDSNKPPGVIMALSKTSGITLWSRTIPSPIQGQLMLLDAGVFGATKDGRFITFNPETGNIVWSTQYPHSLSDNIILVNRRLIVSTLDGMIISLDGRTGRQIWRYRTPDRVRCTIAAAGSKVFVGSANGYLTALEETATGVVLNWRKRVGTSVTGVTYSSQGVIAITGDNFVQLLSHRRGSRLWKQRMPGRVFAQPLVDTRNALFATHGGDACIVISLKSGKQVNIISVGEGNHILAMPVLSSTSLIIPTRLGLMAFGQPNVN